MEPSAPDRTAGHLVKESYFPTLIYFRDLPDAEALNAQLRTLIADWQARDPHGIERSNERRAGTWHSPVDMHVRREFDALTRQIFATVQRVYEDLGYDAGYEPACDSMWANVSPRHGLNRHHTHPNVLWSGVYYVQCPENSGRLYFSDPRVQAQVLVPRYAPGAARKRDVWNEVFYEPVAGRVILFPSWLAHAVQPNLAAADGPDGWRISVSFNFFQRKRGSVPAPGMGDSEYPVVIAEHLTPDAGAT